MKFLEWKITEQDCNADILQFVSLQESLLDSNCINNDEILHKCKEIKEKYREIILIHISNAIDIRPVHFKSYIKLIQQLFIEFGAEFVEISLYYLPLKAIRVLYDNGQYSIDQIMMFDSIRRGLDQYFIPEFNLTKLKRPIDGLTDSKGNVLKEMIENNFEKYKEFLIFGNNKLFQELLESNDIKSFTKLVESGSYKFTNEISLSSLYSNYNFFIFCSKYQKITKEVVENAYIGGNKEIIKYCQENIDFSEENFLKICIKYQRNELIEEMVEKGFEWTINDAVRSLNYRLILFALFLGEKESNEDDEYKRSILHFCGHFGDYLIGEFLIEKGFDKDSVDDDGRSVAYEAASSYKSSFLKMLISKNVDLEKKNLDGISAYKRALMSKDIRTRNVVCNLNK